MPFDKPYNKLPKFNRRTVNHVVEATQRVEAMPYPSHRPPPVFIPRPVMTPGPIEAIATSNITAFNTNSNTYGSGTCQPYTSQFNTNTNSYMQVVDSSFGNSSLVLNHYTSNTNGVTVSSGTRITVAFRNGSLLLLTSDC